MLAFFDSGARNVYNSRRAIKGPSDLRGLRIRVPQDPVAIDTFNTLGASHTPTSRYAISGKQPSAPAGPRIGSRITSSSPIRRLWKT